MTPQGLADKRLADRLERWRIRGAAARIARDPRQPPPQPRSIAAELAAQIAGAWLEGFDGTRPAYFRERER